MPYELNLRPRTRVRISEDELRARLLDLGLTPRSDTVPPGMFAVPSEILSHRHSLLQIVQAPEIPAGIRVVAKVPYGLDFWAFLAAFLELQEIGKALDADVTVGEDPNIEITPDERGFCLAIGLGAHYDRCSRMAINVLGRSGSHQESNS